MLRAAALVLLAGAAAAQARPEPPVAPLARLPAGVPPPVIDGDLRDPAWDGATLLGPLVQTVPRPGAEPSEPTEVRVLVDATTFYVSLLCLDSAPGLIRDSQMKRDANLDPDDRVELLIDPFLDKRNGFWFQIGAGGSKGDALITKNGSSFNKRWDGIWFGRARVTERGWQAEMAIPIATLSFDPGATAWGFNLRRFIRRRSEEVRWAAPAPRVSFFSLANAGVLTGVGGLRQAVGLDVEPFVVADWRRDRLDDDEEGELDGGLDAFWSVTPATKLSLSWRTDFAETEVDERQVNLTRFPLFFPEKRDFFLEDAGAFFFGYGEEDVIPFFSRRIGLDEDGQEVPLLLATKVTTFADSFSLGVLDVQTEATSSVDETNLFVGRFSKYVLEQSDVGVIWTAGDPKGDGFPDGDAATYGADLNLRTDDFLDDRNLRFSAWVLRTEGEDAGGDDLAWSARASYPNDEVDLAATWTVVGDDFDPALGFVPRRGIEKLAGAFRLRPRLNTAVRRLLFAFEPEWVTDRDGDTESLNLRLEPLGVELESGDTAVLAVEREREVLVQDFEIADGVVIPADDYGAWRYGVELETSDKRRASAILELESGEFFEGERDDLALELDLRTSKHLLAGLGYERNDVRLPGGDFTVNVGRLRLELLANPRLSWTNFLQYDDVSEQLGLNSRLWWILRPGSEAFLVLNQGWDADGGLHPTIGQWTFKLGTTFRF